MNIRQYLPSPLKRRYQLFKRYLRYHLRQRLRYATPGAAIPDIRVTIRQEIKPTGMYHNKVANIRLAAAKITPLVIRPGAVLSFWKAVGQPDARHGFLPGRNIRNGVLTTDYGGGLCQLSGLLYYLALQSGLRVIERHNHSMDIYTDAERFTPLGSDATVVYGYKDLIIQNNLSADIQFCITVTADTLTGMVCCSAPLEPVDIRFEVHETPDGKRVQACNSGNEVVGESWYRIPL